MTSGTISSFPTHFCLALPRFLEVYTYSWTCSSRKRRSSSSVKRPECGMLHALAFAKGEELLCVGWADILILFLRLIVWILFPGTSRLQNYPQCRAMNTAHCWKVHGEIIFIFFRHHGRLFYTFGRFRISKKEGRKKESR
jgi:hypothetical protein